MSVSGLIAAFDTFSVSHGKPFVPGSSHAFAVRLHGTTFLHTRRESMAPARFQHFRLAFKIPTVHDVDGIRRRFSLLVDTITQKVRLRPAKVVGLKRTADRHR